MKHFDKFLEEAKISEIVKKIEEELKEFEIKGQFIRTRKDKPYHPFAGMIMKAT